MLEAKRSPICPAPPHITPSIISMISPAPAFHTFCIRNTSAPPIPPPTKPNMLPATVLFGLRRGQSFFLPKSLPPKYASVSPISGIANAHSSAILLLSASAPYSHSIATAAKRLIGYTSTNMDAIVSCAVRASVNILSAIAISMHAIATIHNPMPPNTLYAAKYSSANIYAGSMNGFSSFLASALPISYAAITAEQAGQGFPVEISGIGRIRRHKAGCDRRRQHGNKYSGDSNAFYKLHFPSNPPYRRFLCANSPSAAI